MQCYRCGTNLGENDRFCSACGADLFASQNAIPGPMYLSPLRKVSKGALGWAIAALVLSIGSGIIMFFITRSYAYLPERTLLLTVGESLIWLLPLILVFAGPLSGKNVVVATLVLAIFGTVQYLYRLVITLAGLRFISSITIDYVLAVVVCDSLKFMMIAALALAVWFGERGQPHAARIAARIVLAMAFLIPLADVISSMLLVEETFMMKLAVAFFAPMLQWPVWIPRAISIMFYTQARRKEDESMAYQTPSHTF